MGKLPFSVGGSNIALCLSFIGLAQLRFVIRCDVFGVCLVDRFLLFVKYTHGAVSLSAPASYGIFLVTPQSDDFSEEYIEFNFFGETGLLMRHRVHWSAPCYTHALIVNGLSGVEHDVGVAVAH